MSRHQYRRAAPSRSGRRQSLWLDIVTTETTLAGAPSVALLNSLSAAALALRPFTIVRTRGTLLVLSDQSGASESYGAALGFAVVSLQASNIGVSAVPTPVTDKGSDLFFVFENLFDRFQFGDNTGEQSNSGRMIQYDSKAMRKVNDDQDIVVTIENEINGAIVIHSARMLLELH